MIAFVGSLWALPQARADTTCTLHVGERHVQLDLRDGNTTSRPQVRALHQVCDKLAAYLNLPSQPWEATVARHVAASLEALDYFASVTCDPQPPNLRCSLHPQRMITRSVIRGRLPWAMLRSELQRRVFLRAGMAIDDIAADSRKQKERLEAYLRAEGYFASRVEVHDEADSQGYPNAGTRLLIDVEVGRTKSLGDVVVHGAPTDLAAAVSSYFIHKHIFWLGTRRFIPAELEFDVAAATAHLQDLGFFAAHIQPRYRYIAEDRDIHLEIFVSLGPRVTLAFTGNMALSAAKLQRQLTFVQAGAFDALEIENSRQKIVEAYEAAGYDTCDVRHTLQASPQFTSLSYIIAEGPRRHIAAVRFTGNNAVAPASLQRQCTLATHASGWFKQRYRTQNVQHDVAALRRYYLSQGFEAVAIKSCRRALSDGGLEIIFDISEGVRRRVGEVTIGGGPPEVDTGALRASLRLQPGQPFVAQHLQDDADHLREALATAGYLHNDVRASQSSGQSPVMLRYDLAAGSKAQVGQTFVAGALRTSPRTIEHELRLQPGAPLDLAALGAGRRRLRSLGIFTDVQLRPLPKRADTSEVSLQVSVQERAVQSLDAVVSFSTDEYFGLGADFHDRNMWGRAIGVDGQLRFGNASEWLGHKLRLGNVDRISLTTRAPSPLGLPLDAEVNAFYRYFDLAYYTSQLGGGSAAVLRTFLPGGIAWTHPNLTGRLAYELIKGSQRSKQGADLGKLARTAPRDVPSATIARLVPSLTFDARDTPLDPHGGWTAEGRFELGLPALGGPLYEEVAPFWRTMVSAQIYGCVASPRLLRLESGQSVGGDIVLAASVSFHLAGPLGSAGFVPNSETFAYGGDFSVRGLPRDASRLSMQARAMVTGSAELRIYLFRLGFGVIQLAGFVDMGTVAYSCGALFAQTTLSAGPAVRYVTPVGPLSLAWGVPLVVAPELTAVAPTHGRLHFSFGYAF